jgi:hypothetical protein
MCIICFVQLMHKAQDKRFQIINHVQWIKIETLLKR